MQFSGILPYTYEDNRHRPKFSPILFLYSLVFRSILLTALPIQFKRMQSNPWNSVGDIAYDFLMVTYVTTVILAPLSHLFHGRKLALFFMKLKRWDIKGNEKHTFENIAFIFYTCVLCINNYAMQETDYFYPDDTRMAIIYWRIIVFIVALDIFVFVFVVNATFHLMSATVNEIFVLFNKKKTILKRKCHSIQFEKMISRAEMTPCKNFIRMCYEVRMGKNILLV